MKSLRFAFTLMLASIATGQPVAPDKLFAVTITTGPAWDAAKPPNEQKFFKEHSANLARLRAAGLAILGGRFADKGLIIDRAFDADTVRTELAKDPSIGAGVFQAAVDEYRPFYHGDTRPPATSPEIAVVRASVAAYNTHNAAAVAAHYADDLKWFSVADDKQSVDGDGRKAVEKWLAGYFKSLPDVRAEIFDVTQTGPHVSYRERSSWTAKDGARQTQTSIAVYEVRDGKIKRAWYFPAARDPAPPVAKQ